MRKNVVNNLKVSKMKLVGTNNSIVCFWGMVIISFLLSASCENEVESPFGNNKYVIQTSIGGITYRTVSIHSLITSPSTKDIISQCGHCWSLQPYPDLSGSHSISEMSTIEKLFISELTGLQLGTAYYVRPYIIVNNHAIYGLMKTFVTTSATLPVVETSIVSNISNSSAQCGGNIINDGGSDITVRGVCWGINKNPTVNINDKTSDGSGSGNFSSTIGDLIAGTTYYVRAYATNSVGTAYGNLEIFNATPGSVTDMDENVYTTVTIGDQVWMAENLRTTKFRNGDTIPYWTNTVTSGYCWYNNSITYKNLYGAIYQYYAATDTRGICPSGWHLPSIEEWNTLFATLGGEDVAGGKMKEQGTVHWNSPNTGATNSSGFTALPGGMKDCSNNFVNMGSGCSFYTAQEAVGGYIWGVSISAYSTTVETNSGFDCNASSIRCIKNQE